MRLIIRLLPYLLGLGVGAWAFLVQASSGGGMGAIYFGILAGLVAAGVGFLLRRILIGM